MIATNNSAMASSIRNKVAGLLYEDWTRLAKRIIHCAAGENGNLCSPLSRFHLLDFSLWRSQRNRSRDAAIRYGIESRAP